MKNETYEACIARKNAAQPGESFWQELADQFGYKSGEALRSAVKSETKKRNRKEKSPEETTTYRETDSEIYISYANTTIKTKDDVIREYKIDTTKWKIKSFEVSPRQVYRKDRSVNWDVLDGKVVSGKVRDSGKLLVATIFNIRVKFEPINSQNISFDDIVKFYKDKDFKCSQKFPSYPKSDERVLEICLADAHIGAPSYDGSSMEESFHIMMADIFDRLENDSIGFTKIVLVPLGDIFHYDTEKKQTSYNQTVVEGNGISIMEMYDKAVHLFTGVVTKLLEFAPVEVLYIPGNHDAQVLYHLINHLAAYFRDVDGFSADLVHKPRKWRLIGKNLVGFHHGQMSKKNQVHWLQIEARDAWAKSKYAETHGGHWHHEELMEHGGIKLRTLPAIAVTDNWHYREGYVGNTRATMCFIWNEDSVGWSDMWQCVGIR